MNFLRKSRKWINASVYVDLRSFQGRKNVIICWTFSMTFPMTFFQTWNISQMYRNVTLTQLFVTFRCIFINIISCNYSGKED